MKAWQPLISLLVLLASTWTLTSCGGKREQSTSTLVLKSLAIEAGKGGGGAVVHARHMQSGQTRIIPFDEAYKAEGVELDLANGRWTFSAAVWNGTQPMQGELECAGATVDLQGLGDVEVDLTLKAEDCLAGQVQNTQLQLAVCRPNKENLSNTPTLAADCLATSFVGSYRVVVETNSIHGMNLNSGCIAHTDANSIIQNSNIHLPANPSWERNIKVETFGTSDCDASNSNAQKVIYTLGASGTLYGGKLTEVSGNLSAVMVSPCPPGYLYVSGDSVLGTQPFCVMQYEAREDSGDSDPIAHNDVHTNTPWDSDFDDAFENCANLNDNPPMNPSLWGGSYSLISNAQWVAIMENVASVNANLNSGNLYPGHSDNNPSNELGINDLGNFADGTAGDNNSPERRVFELATGGILWDFAGNLAEWVAGPESDGSFPLFFEGSNVPNTCDSWRWLDQDEDEFGETIMIPVSYSRSPGWGKWCREGSDANYAMRGGDYETPEPAADSSNANAHGLGQLIMNNGSADLNGTGFRCVFNLPY